VVQSVNKQDIESILFYALKELKSSKTGSDNDDFIPFHNVRTECSILRIQRWGFRIAISSPKVHLSIKRVSVILSTISP
jgi:hypothetical protein